MKMLALVSYIVIDLICITTSNTLYNVASWNTTITNSLYPAARKEIEVYVKYPEVASNNELFPLILFAHCLSGSLGYYDYIWQSAVPNGYIFIETPPLDNDKEMQMGLARDIRYILDWVIDNCTQCPFKNIIANKSFVSGHSMGAGSVLYILGEYWLGEAFKYSFDSGMTLSVCGSIGDELITAAKNITKPVLLFDGSHDCMCPPSIWSDMYYNLIPNNTEICKYETIITNGTHCNFAELDEAEEASCIPFEESTCKQNNTMSHIKESIQLQLTMQYMNLFMNATLYNDNNPHPFNALNQKIQNDLQNGVVAKTQSLNCN